MIVLPESTKTATVLNVHGENGVWKKPKSLGNNKGGKLNKIEINEKRNYQRWHYKGSIWLTNFNKTNLMGAQTSNHCPGGICFKSNTCFKSQTILLLRINNEGWDFSCTGDLEGLRMVTLGEVKWCKDIPYKTTYGYETGIRYLAPDF